MFHLGYYRSVVTMETIGLLVILQLPNAIVVLAIATQILPDINIKNFTSKIIFTAKNATIGVKGVDC